jgi:hypothetical protein
MIRLPSLSFAERYVHSWAVSAKTFVVTFPSYHLSAHLQFMQFSRGTSGRCTFSNTHRILITTEYLQSHIHSLLEQIRKDGTAASDETLRHESTASLARLGLRTDTRADARGAGAASRRAVGGSEALATNKLLARAVPDVGDTCGVEGRASSGVGAGLGGGGGSSSGSSGGAGGEAARAGDEAAAGLACLGLSTRARADARGTSAAARGAVSGVKALATDELLARAVAYIGDTCGVEGGSTSGVGASSGSCGGCSRSGGRGGGGSCGGGSCGGGSGSSGAGGEDLEVARGVEDGLEIITDDSLEFVRAGNKSKLSTYWLR